MLWPVGEQEGSPIAILGTVELVGEAVIEVVDDPDMLVDGCDVVVDDVSASECASVLEIETAVIEVAKVVDARLLSDREHEPSRLGRLPEQLVLPSNPFQATLAPDAAFLS